MRLKYQQDTRGPLIVSERAEALTLVCAPFGAHEERNGHVPRTRRKIATDLPRDGLTFPCRSVVDVGRGAGAWLKAFDESGVRDCVGYDGNHVTRDILLSSWDRSYSAELRYSLPIKRRYHIACSLEVAQHCQPTRHMLSWRPLQKRHPSFYSRRLSRSARTWAHKHSIAGLPGRPARQKFRSGRFQLPTGCVEHLR